MKRGVSAQVSQGDCAFQAHPYRHGFQHGCSQVVSPVVGLCQYGAPEASSTCSSHPGGSGGALMARGGGSAGGLAAEHVTRESRPPSPDPPPATAAGCSQVVSPVLSLYQCFCGARGWVSRCLGTSRRGRDSAARRRKRWGSRLGSSYCWCCRAGRGATDADERQQQQRRHSQDCCVSGVWLQNSSQREQAPAEAAPSRMLPVSSVPRQR